MKLLLTSAGIKNPTIQTRWSTSWANRSAEASALCIPTAMYGHPWVGPGERHGSSSADRNPGLPMASWAGSPWAVLELTALPSIDEERWVPLVQETDVLLAQVAMPCICATGCGSPGWQTCCRRWTRPVWVGLSAGSMVMTPRIGDDFVGWKPPTGGDETLGIVTSRSSRTWITRTAGEHDGQAEEWAAGSSCPAYAIDDETAIKVVNGTVEVVSEGNWKLLARQV